MLSVILISLILNTKTAYAAATNSITPTQVPFFKSIESRFPSGYASIESLRKQQVSSLLAEEKVYRWNHKLFKTDEINPIFPMHLSKYILDAKTKKKYLVVDTFVNSIQVTNAESGSATSGKKNEILKFKIDQVLADPYDLGFALTLKDVYLKKQAEDSSVILTTVPAGQRFSVTNYKNGYAKVNYHNYAGYIRLSEVITKFDFATMILSDNKWQFIKQREYDNIITIENKKVHLSQINGLVTPEQRGLIASSSQKIPLWSQVEVIKENRSNWIQSALKGHGHVWWSPVATETENFLTIDDLLKREIASVSFNPKNPQKGILSANGVYTTEDGYYWKKISQFEDFNGPVHYFNDILLFVGNYRSTDGGKTFENYIQIDKLTSAIENQYGFLPKRLQVKKIETKAPYKIKIEIETGLRKIKMESPLFAQDWKAVKL